MKEENARLLRANKALLKGLASMTSETEVAQGGYTKEEKEVGLSQYKCVARNNCISTCQEEDEDKTWYRCMKECPKSLCEKRRGI